MRGLVVKAYFIPDLRSISSGQSKERMIGDVLNRVGLEKPWSMLTDFFSTLATQPDLFLVAVNATESTPIPPLLNYSPSKLFYRSIVLQARPTGSRSTCGFNK